jgi:hypothetical protein
MGICHYRRSAAFYSLMTVLLMDIDKLWAKYSVALGGNVSDKALAGRSEGAPNDPTKDRADHHTDKQSKNSD